MRRNNLERRSDVIRAGIKATIGQLDRWALDQAEQERRRTAANARYPNGLTDRLTHARHLARQGTRTTDFAVSTCCRLCDSGAHSTETCDVTQSPLESLETAPEDPSTGTHRAIVHRVCLQACDLYRLLCPRFYPGPEPRIFQPEEVYPSPLTGPDYLALGVNQAAEDLQASPFVTPSDVRRQRINCTQVVHLCCSKSLPLNFSEFCHLVATKVEEDSEENQDE
jgi:hypothetical protein